MISVVNFHLIVMYLTRNTRKATQQKGGTIYFYSLIQQI